MDTFDLDAADACPDAPAVSPTAESPTVESPTVEPMKLRLLRFAPFAVVAAATWMLLAWSGVPHLPIALYALYWLVTAVVPGVLVWRWIGIRSSSLAEDLVAGATLGISIHVVLNFFLGYLSLTRFTVVWSLAVLLAFAAIPSLRRHWLGSRETPMPWSANLGIAATSLGVIWWAANNGFRVDEIAPLPGLAGQWYAPVQYLDFPYHQGLASAVLRGSNYYPFTYGIRLRYPIMPYEHLADAARWTGIDLTLLTLRLQWVIPLGLAVALCGLIAYRIAGTGRAAAFGAALGYFTSPFVFGNVASLNYGIFWSVTQTFGQPLFHLLVLLAVILVTDGRLSARLAVPLVFVSFAASASKVTFMPKLLCALAGVFLLGLLWKKHRTRPVLILGAAFAVAFAATMLLVVGTNGQGADVDFGRRTMEWISFTNPIGPVMQYDGLRMFAMALVIGVWLFTVIAAFAALILRRRDLASWLLAGIGLAGMCATLLGATHGASQLYFLRGAWPLMGVLAGLGISELVERAGQRSRAVWIAVGSLAAGFAVMLGVRAVVQTPEAFVSRTSTYAQLLAPIAAVALVAVGAFLAVRILLGRASTAERGDGGRRATAVAALVAISVAQGSAFAWAINDTRGILPSTDLTNVQPTLLPTSGALAARWLRDNSDAGDLVATNMHCRVGLADGGFCDSRQFWLSAMAERNVLLEGWEYSAPDSDIAPVFHVHRGLFWDIPFLHANDAAFNHPSPETIGWLANRGVTWMFVDHEIAAASDFIGDHAEFVYSTGRFSIYRIDG